MSTNKATYRRFLDAINTGELATISKTIDDIVHPDLVFHAPIPPGTTGAQAMKQVWAVLLRAFPDIQVAGADVIAEGDKLACRNVVTGTHLGEYLGLAPTGRSITYNEMFIVRFAEGRAAEIWPVVDGLSQRTQLGLIPAQ